LHALEPGVLGGPCSVFGRCAAFSDGAMAELRRLARWHGACSLRPRAGLRAGPVAHWQL